MISTLIVFGTLSQVLPVSKTAARSVEPTPVFAAQVAEECRRLLSILNDGELRELAIWKMEGFTNEEIAGKIDRSIPTVERKLARIRKLWERETPE